MVGISGKGSLSIRGNYYGIESITGRRNLPLFNAVFSTYIPDDNDNVLDSFPLSFVSFLLFWVASSSLLAKILLQEVSWPFMMTDDVPHFSLKYPPLT